MQQALTAGSIQFGLGSGPGMGFMAKGVPAKAVAAFAGPPGNMALLVGTGDKIKSVDDLAGKKIRVLPRDVQFHPVTEKPLHVDFLRVGADTEIRMNVPVLFENEVASPGLKRGGVLNVVRHEIEVLCSAANIPQNFRIDLTGLDIGDSVHISQVSLPPGVRPTIADRDFTIATVAAPTVAAVEEMAPAAPAPEEEAAVPVPDQTGPTPEGA